MIVPFSEVILHTLIDMWRQDHYRKKQTQDWPRRPVFLPKEAHKTSKRYGYQHLLKFAQFGVPTIYAIILVLIILIGLFNVYKMS